MFSRISVVPETQLGRVVQAWLSSLAFHITSLSTSPLFPQIWQQGDIARNCAQQQGCEEPLWGWCRRCTCPQRWHCCSSDFSRVLQPNLHWQDVCYERVRFTRCWIRMKFTGPRVHTICGLVLFDKEFTQLVNQYLIQQQQQQQIMCTCYLSGQELGERFLSHYCHVFGNCFITDQEDFKIFSLANCKSTSLVSKTLWFYHKSPYLFLKIWLKMIST